jgi:3-hydroxymyristoyl/3-hydroxydecanoyl-(acyl carrier protein) dehydratase
MNAVRKQIRSMLTAERRDGGFHGRLTVDPNFVLFPDHFRSQPILPGICMLQAVLIAAETACGLSDLHLYQLKNSKLLQPVLPGDQLLIEGDITSDNHGDLAIKARLFVADQKRAEFSLVARGAQVGDAPAAPFPSPGTPGEGQGGGSGSVTQGLSESIPHLPETPPPPQPSPGVPGEGENFVGAGLFNPSGTLCVLSGTGALA